MKIIVTGGGTGGHLQIAKVFIEELLKRGIEVIYIGSTNGQDKAWFFDDNRIEKYFFETSGVVNKNFFGRITPVLKIVEYAFSVKKIIKENSVKCVISVGGYSAASASFGALLSNIPLFIHEQNAYIGTLNRLLKGFSKEFFSSYFEPIYPYPIDKKFFNNRVRTEIKTIIFLGGSQGAVFINDFAIKIAKELNNKGISIIHQTGKKDFNRVKEFYEKNNIDAEVFDFSKEIEKYFYKADLAISRSGASTMWELVANLLPAIFIPYPYAANDHQYYNALFLKEKGLCEIKRQQEIKVKDIFEFMNKDIKDISEKLSLEIKPNGGSIIIEKILSLI